MISIFILFILFLLLHFIDPRTWHTLDHTGRRKERLYIHRLPPCSHHHLSLLFSKKLEIFDGSSQIELLVPGYLNPATGTAPAPPRDEVVRPSPVTHFDDDDDDDDAPPPPPPPQEDREGSIELLVRLEQNVAEVWPNQLQ